MIDLTKSKAAFEEARKFMPGGVKCVLSMKNSTAMYSYFALHFSRRTCRTF